MAKPTKAIIIFWGIEKDNSKNLAYRAEVETDLALEALGEDYRKYLLKSIEWNQLFSKSWKAKLRNVAINLLPVPTPVRTFLGDYVGDVLDFFLSPSLRDEAQSLYLNALAEVEAAGIKFEDTIVVGYSLGSLMSANCMRDRHEPIGAYIHLASPFGCSIRAIGSACRRFFGQDLYGTVVAKKRVSVYSQKDAISGPWLFTAGSIFDEVVNATAKHEDYQHYLADGLAWVKGTHPTQR